MAKLNSFFCIAGISLVGRICLPFLYPHYGSAPLSTQFILTCMYSVVSACLDPRACFSSPLKLYIHSLVSYLRMTASTISPLPYRLFHIEATGWNARKRSTASVSSMGGQRRLS